MDLKKIENSIKNILEAIGENPEREGLRDTPKRVARMYKELLSGYTTNSKNLFTEFDKKTYGGMIVLSDTDIYSLCEHHMLSFFGKAHIGYIPDKKIIGVSKIARIIDKYARRLQTQEQLTTEIAEEIERKLKPRGVGVVLQARHLCMETRGVRKQNSIMTTSEMLGEFRDNEKTRNEFLQLIKK